MSDEITTPNPADFSRNDRPREYEAIFDVRGTVRIAIMADSMDDAKKQAQAELDKMLDDDGFGVELDDVDEVRINWVRKESPMFRVTRDGKTMQVTRLAAGDIPREPDERGF